MKTTDGAVRSKMEIRSLSSRFIKAFAGPENPAERVAAVASKDLLEASLQSSCCDAAMAVGALPKASREKQSDD